jgi:hypothetical protein
MPEKPVKRRLKLILLFRSVPNDDINFGSCWRGLASSSDSRPTSLAAEEPSEVTRQGSGLTDRRNEAVAEVTLVVSAVAMIAAIVAAVRR